MSSKYVTTLRFYLPLGIFSKRDEPGGKNCFSHKIKSEEARDDARHWSSSDRKALGCAPGGLLALISTPRPVDEATRHAGAQDMLYDNLTSIQKYILSPNWSVRPDVIVSVAFPKAGAS